MPGSNQKQVKSPGQNRLLANWGGSMTGVVIGGLGGNIAFAHMINNPPIAALVGATIGAIAGYGLPDLIRRFHHSHQAQ